MDNEVKNISLKELSEIEKLSVRSQNVCEWNCLNDITKILNYFWDNNDFLQLRNCGQKSNSELINVCRKYENFIIKSDAVIVPENLENPISDKIENLTVRQKKIYCFKTILENTKK